MADNQVGHSERHVHPPDEVSPEESHSSWLAEVDERLRRLRDGRTTSISLSEVLAETEPMLHGLHPGEEVDEAEAHAAWSVVVAERSRQLREGTARTVPAAEVYAKAEQILDGKSDR